jgi:peptidoglycan endopeptidase LytF
LDRISVYSMALGSHRLSLRDHVRSSVAQSTAGVAFAGTASPSALPLSAFTDAGLSPPQAAALKLVSSFEGNFDAINTYDRALVSAGFIQFAGGRGLPPYLALLKARQSAKFRDLLQKFGIDVEYTASGNAIASARIVVLDPGGTRVLRGTAAETAIRDDKRLTTALILSGRDRDVQAVQIEAAARGYVYPALSATMTPSTDATRPRRLVRAQLGQILRSQKGMAALLDRAIQEGVGAATRRFERLIQGLVRSAERALPPAPAPPLPASYRAPTEPSSLAALQSREGDVLAELERDLQAAADIAANVARARTLLDTVIRAAGAAGATVAGLAAQPALADARRAVTNARAALADVVNLSGANDDAQFRRMAATLTAEATRLALTPPPASVAELTTTLTASNQALAGVTGSVSTAPMFLARVRRIRRSTLDSGLAEGV